MYGNIGFNTINKKKSKRENSSLDRCVDLNFVHFCRCCYGKLALQKDTCNRGGGGVLPYIRYICMCRGIGYGF